MAACRRLLAVALVLIMCVLGVCGVPPLRRTREHWLQDEWARIRGENRGRELEDGDLGVGVGVADATPAVADVNFMGERLLFAWGADVYSLVWMSYGFRLVVCAGRVYLTLAFAFQVMRRRLRLAEGCTCVYEHGPLLLFHQTEHDLRLYL